MENKQLENNNKKASKKTIKLSEISDINNGDLWYMINNKNKVSLMYKDMRCRI